jgi:hypothetical protein
MKSIMTRAELVNFIYPELDDQSKRLMLNYFLSLDEEEFQEIIFSTCHFRLELIRKFTYIIHV